MTEATQVPDGQTVAREELAVAMTPDPKDLFEDLSPLGVLFFTHQTVYACLGAYVAGLEADPEAQAEDDGKLARALQAIATAAGNLDAAGALMGLLPDEAVQTT